jgi:hypothetical protein
LIFDLEQRWKEDGGLGNEKPAILDEKLTTEEWRVVTALQRIFEPFKIATLQLQGDGSTDREKRSTTGALYEYFPVIDMLLDYLERTIDGVLLV